MATQSDPIFETVTAPGTPFELGVRGGMRRFVNAPSDLGRMLEAARAHGDRLALVDGDTRLTFGQLFARSDALAAMLGIARGDRVAICMRNRAEWMIAFLAAIRCGGVAALLNSRGSPAELCAAIDDVAPAVVLADRDRAARLREGGFAGRLIAAADFPAPGDAAPPDVAPAASDDPAAILFTSGTTGRVKGAVLTHENLITGILGMQLSGTMVLHNTAARLGIPVATILANLPQQAVMLAVPLFHISGLGAGFLAPLLAGSKIVMVRRWSAESAAELIGREQVTMFSGVPTMMWDLVRAGTHRGADLSSLRNVGMGGQALSVGLLNEFRAACPEVVMGTGYGMTETSGSVAMGMGEDFIRKSASAGRALSLVEMRIEGADGAPLPAGEAGEIVVRGPMVMQGYWRQPEATAAVLSPDGWLRTGDIGYLDAEGYLFIVDRAKDMVISGGENIYCAEVEQVLAQHPCVADAALVGLPHPVLGEVPAAMVQLRPGAGVSAEALRAFAADRLAAFKVPERIVLRESALPRNAGGKLLKKELRKAFPP
jgi:acyl-CoA synthetase (AMP-forming)/AMP-acid ligase II